MHLSPLETICIKCQNLFSAKNNINNSVCYLLNILPSILSVYMYCIQGAERGTFGTGFGFGGPGTGAGGPPTFGRPGRFPGPGVGGGVGGPDRGVAPIRSMNNNY